MLSKYLKKTLVFSVVTAGIFLFVLSCENPFSNNLGSKVDVEYPTVTIDSPVVGSFVKSSVQFAGVGTAYRDLRKVEVRILNPKDPDNPDDDPLPPLLDWTEIQISGEAKQKNWVFDLDTVNSTYIDKDGVEQRLQAPLDDGFLKIQFRASDPNLVAESVVSVFVVKNKPSTIKMTAPDPKLLVNINGTLNLDYPPTIINTQELLGNIIDPRGIKPGYPQIKFWPERLAVTNPEKIDPATGEPFDNDTDWGWAQLFLSGIDRYEDEYGPMEGEYADRGARPVEKAGNFSFKLSEYTIDPNTRQVKYILDGGQFKPLPAGEEYRFKIKTFETFFDDNLTLEDGEKNPRHMFPRNPEGGEVETPGYSPDPADPALANTLPPVAYKVLLISEGTLPEVALDFSDAGTDAELKAREPHIYITQPTDKKILINGAYRAVGDTSRKSFRLRVRATHDDFIERATLRWEHTAGATLRSGDLEWDDVYDDANLESLGYYDSANKATQGHRGAWKDPARQVDGKLFQFTATVAHAEFISSSEPYSFYVMAYSTGNQRYKEYKYTLYLDGDGPKVAIRSVRGASEASSGATRPDVSNVNGVGNGTIVESPYIVNGNIQVSIERTASMGVIASKWLIEEDIADYFNTTANPNTTYAKLIQFRGSPAAANLGFYNSIVAGTPSTAVSGLVDAANANGEFQEDRTSNFKINVGRHNPKTLWLYVIVQDGVYNLGYTIQKLVVNEGTDQPNLNISGLDGTITSAQGLFINKLTNPDKERVNVLGRGNGIELNFSDDDNVRPLAEKVGGQDRAGGITITITALNTNTARTVDIASLIPPPPPPSPPPSYLLPGEINFTKREWNGILTQALMAQTLYGSASDGYLLDGLYRLDIEIKDDSWSKVIIDELPAANPVNRSIFFAVHSEKPQIIIDNPSINNSMQTSTPITVHGRVISRVKIQKMDISFNPDVVSSPLPTNPTQGPVLALELFAGRTINQTTGAITWSGQYANETAALAATVTPDANGNYVYYWRRTNVNFDPAGLFPNAASRYDWRRFTLNAWDGLDEQGTETRDVQVDTTPPEVRLVDFNFGRLHWDFTKTVNGKVPIEISATDLNGIKKAENGDPEIKWFIQPSTNTTPPTWNTTSVSGGRMGKFTAAHDQTGGRYRIIINTVIGDYSLSANTYDLYVIAEDNAGNRNTVTSLEKFTVNQASDNPYLRPERMAPLDNGTIGGDNPRTSIVGQVYDDDGFYGLPNTIARRYVKIRFRQSNGTIWQGSWQRPEDGATVTTDTNGWADVHVLRSESGVSSGELQYTFSFVRNPNTPNEVKHPYFADGVKEYQLMVVDEVEPGPGTPPDPRGKNPDGVTTGTGAIGSVTRYYPGGTGYGTGRSETGSASSNTTDWYTFTIKVDPPKVKFNPNNPSGMVYGTAATVLAALQGGTIEDTSLNNATFIFGTTQETLTKYSAGQTPPAATGGIVPNTNTVRDQNTWTWTLGSAWLNAAFVSTVRDGVQTVTIRATDTLGKPGFADWTFIKDTTGPAITYGNVSANAIRTISGEAGSISVTGTFSDTYSNIGTISTRTQPSFGYRLWRDGQTAPGYTYVDITGANGALEAGNPKAATWNVAIPGTYNSTTQGDGLWHIQIQVRDALTNSTEAAVVDFVVDRRNPEMNVPVDNLRFINNTTSATTTIKDKSGNAISDGPMVDTDRVFSAPVGGTATDKYFTLSGIVMDHNLSELRVSFRNETEPVTDLARSLAAINLSTIAWINGGSQPGWHEPAAGFRIRRAQTNDFGNAPGGFDVPQPSSLNYYYVWQLDVLRRDIDRLNTLVSSADSPDTTRSVSVLAYDLANRNSGAYSWQFKLDGKPPKITITNPSADGAVMGDQTVILQAQVEDTNNIQAIQYQIEKYASGGTWAPPSSGGTWAITGGTWTDVTSGFKDYDFTAARTVNARITDSAILSNADGYYRVSMRAADGALNTTNTSTTSGNQATTTTPASPVKFFVDRSGPTLTWGTVKSHYRWDSSDNITFTVTAVDGNFIDDTIGNVGDNGGGTLGTTGAKVTYTVTNPNSASATLTVTVNRNGKTIDNGRYTLTLIVKDKAGNQTQAGHTQPFYLDNSKPDIDLDVVGQTNANKTANSAGTVVTSTDAITGRIELRGKFSKQNAGDSSIKRVAFAVATANAPTVPATLDYSTATGIKTADTALRTAGWFFNNGASNITDDVTPPPATPTTPLTPWRMKANDPVNAAPAGAPTGATGLMEIDDGLAVANMKIYDTRRLFATGTASGRIAGAVSAPAGVMFNGKEIIGDSTYASGDRQTRELRIHLLAIDDTGNYNVKTFVYYVFPEGDYPIVNSFTSPKETGAAVDRRLNGSITISGEVVDNYRIQRVWFRVLKDNNGTGAVTTPATDMKIPQWNETTWEELKENGQIVYQRPRNLTGASGASLGDGWFIANGGGSMKVQWWAQINNQGELDPTGNVTERNIIIQTVAEDTILDDDTGQHVTTLTPANPTIDNAVTTTPNLLSKVVKAANAQVVVGAPVFSDERIKPDASAGIAHEDPRWRPILTTNVRGRASYQVIVTHLSAVSAIRWTNAPMSLGANNPTNNVLSDTGATFGSLANNGIEVKAQPKPEARRTGVALDEGTYLILTPFTSGLPSGATGAENVRYAEFTVATSTASIGSAVVMKKNNGVYEWLVTVDINSTALADPDGGTYANKAKNYAVELQALDNSNPTPIAGRRTAQIPIDNMPPRGLYSHSTNVAGSSPTFGGEAGDPDGAVRGLGYVVLWFSRNTTNAANGAENNIVWNEKDYAAGNAKLTFNNGLVAGNSAAITAAEITNWAGRNTRYNNVVMPRLPNETGLADDVNNSCIIIDRQDPMGNQTHHGHKQPMSFQSGGLLGSEWYVGLDSTKIESGRVTAHYIVFDKAGNGTYYNQRLMVLNNVPKINTLTLATDLGTRNLNVAAGLGTGNTNVTFNDATANDMVTRIKAVMGTNLTNAEAGISDPITVDTSKPGVYNVIVDQKDFMVRNSLFGVKIETLVGQNSSTKARYYRVEYVNSTRGIEGVSAFTANTANSQSGIRAGKVYMINNPATNFPWGVLGAQGEFRRGTVFLAMVDGSEVAAALTGNYGTNPSVWELNGAYYSGNGTTTTLTRGNVPERLRFANTNNNSNYDYMYAATTNLSGKSAGFVYRSGAFGTAADYIRDFTTNGGAYLDNLGRPLPYPANINATTGLVPATAQPWNEHSLFIIRVFDGPETDLFGDFALLAVRVNNNDVTPPYAQLYDLNPKTEDNQSRADALDPSGIGNNRTKGGLYNAGTAQEPDKSGHIEPRTTTSLTGAQMGGAAGNGSITRPPVTASAYFTRDTVSGEVIVRGYAEDNQRVGRVDLQFYNEGSTGNPLSTITVLTQAELNADKAITSTLRAPTAITDRVSFKESFDLNRHRVEWSYLWPSDEIPGGENVVGNISVRARAYNANSIVRATNNSTLATASPVAHDDRVHTSYLITLMTPDGIQTPGTPNSATRATALRARSAFDSFNPGFTVGTAGNNFFRYNNIQINLRPYITGFRRNSAEFSHNTRSRQGRYMFAQGETVMVTGYNLRNRPAGTGYTYIFLPGTTEAGRIETSTPSATVAANYGITTPVATRHRTFTVPADVRNAAGAVTTAGQKTGTGLVTLSARLANGTNAAGQIAVNTGGDRPITGTRPNAVQPWNKEFSSGVDGSELWDDFVMVHIWQSEETAVGTGTAIADQGRFKRTTTSPVMVEDPSMAIDPATGMLWSSHNEGGGDGNNTGTTKISSNGDNTATLTVARFLDPIINSDIYISNRPSGYANNNFQYSVWTAYSIIGRAGQTGQANLWRDNGGLYISGPQGGNPQLNGLSIDTNNGFDVAASRGARSQYYVESNIYNGAHETNGNETPTTMYLPAGMSRADPLSINQFRNPHIVTHYDNTYEHIHTAYYDTHTKSMKYRYNRRATPGRVLGDSSLTPSNTSTTRAWTAANVPVYGWTNLDGGWDPEDQTALTNTAPFNQNSVNGVAANERIVLYDNATYRNTTLPTPNPTSTVGRNNIANKNDTGEYNSIALTRGGFPVVAYYDATQQRLKLAVSGTTTPYNASAWVIRDYVIPNSGTSARFSVGTGQYVSLKIDTRGTSDIVHIAALNSMSKQLIYVTGTLTPPSATNGTYGAYQTSGGVLTDVKAMAVDTVGSVGAWCKISLDADGRPWIAYQDESWAGARDGVKVAYYNPTTFVKGSTGTGNFNGEDIDLYGNNISGWEAMHVPTQFRVRTTRLGMENYPTRNYTGTAAAARFWKGAVGYLSDDNYFRIAYYVE